jgi:hypothetical protein
MRISAYAERLLQGLNDIDWMKVSRRVNVIGLGNQLGLWLDFPVMSAGIKSENNNSFSLEKSTRT